MRSTFLTAEWRKLTIFNYAVDPAILKQYLPFKTELDLWNRRCYVSLVGFRFIKTRLKGIMVPFHNDFEEINLRFYVRYNQGGVWRRGVTFIKEIVPKPALTLVANTLYNENYITYPTRHRWETKNGNLDVTYEWKHHGAWDSISMNASANPTEIPIGTEAEFITEHYYGYTFLGNHLSSEYEVQHPRWTMYPVNSYNVNVRFAALYGTAFGFLKDSVPDSVMLAEGSVVAVKSAGKIR